MRYCHAVFIFLALSGFRCARSPDSQARKTNQNSSLDPKTTPAVEDTNLPRQHFFSVAWGCVEVEQAKLDAAAYVIQEYKTAEGPCPATLPVLNQVSEPLLTCQVKIGPAAIPGRYVLYDKRALGPTVDDLKSQGFSESNFCPAIAEKKFR